MAANWAWLRGARLLCLVGVDYHGRHAAMVPPYEAASTANQWRYDRPVPGCIERQFGQVVEAVESAGGRIVNLSPDTKLQAVPSGKWDDANLRFRPAAY